MYQTILVPLDSSELAGRAGLLRATLAHGSAGTALDSATGAVDQIVGATLVPSDVRGGPRPRRHADRAGAARPHRPGRPVLGLRRRRRVAAGQGPAAPSPPPVAR